MKRFLCILLVLTLMAAYVPPMVVSAEEERPADIPLEVTICALNEDDQEYLTIPEELQSWSAGGRSVRRVSGSGCEVDIEDGVVKPHGEMEYWHQNGPGGMWIGTSEPTGLEGEIANFEYDFGDCVVIVDEKWEVTVYVLSYETYYAEQVVDTYLDENIKEGMTEYEIAELCCKFVASYDYSTEATSYAGMISRGGGDCWASTSALLYMLEKENIQCQSRDASTDAGAGSGHVNVVALLDGEYYILDAGYVGSAPRLYSLSHMEASSIFTYIKDEYEVCITGLILSEGITNIIIPSEIDGLPVTEISNGAFSCNHELVSVTLPDTVKSIGEEAFFQNYALESIYLPEGLETIGLNCFAFCESLKELNIPSTVKEIEGNVCCYCDNLTAVNVHEDNAVYSSQDDVLFDKAMETLLIFPAGKGEYGYEQEANSDGSLTPVPSLSFVKQYTIPNGVRNIAGWCFTGVCLNTVCIPDTVDNIESRAFYNSRIYELTLPEGLEVINSDVFNSTEIESLTLPSSLKRIEDYAFYRGHLQSALIIPDGVEYVGDYAFAGNLNLCVGVPASVQEIGESAFDFDLGWFTLAEEETPSYHNTGAIFLDKVCSPSVIEENAFDTETMCVYRDSYMHTYAKEHDLRWYLTNSDGTVELKQEWLIGISRGSDDTYTGKPVEPELWWEYDEGYCPFAIDESFLDITCEDNINIGTTNVTVTGKGLLSGTATTEFTIYEADPDDDVIDRSGCGLQYWVEEDHVEIVSYIASVIPEKLVIPETLEGLPVTVINDCAFENCQTLKEVTIPGSITYIGCSAFDNASNLEAVRFTGDMPEIDWEALLDITAYYPSGNDTWKLSKLSETGAEEWLSWCASHKFGKWTVKQKATCEKEGKRVRRCTNCDETEIEVIPVKDHTEVVDVAVAPTCTESGMTEGKHCSVCDTVLLVQNAVPATGHQFTDDADGVCDVCGYEREIETDILLGDVDSNGDVDFFDAMCVLQYYAGLIDVAQLNTIFADVDFSGSIDFFDGMYILQFYAGVIDELPVIDEA